MPIRKSSAVWNGNLKDGNGKLRVGEGVFEASYSFASRFEEGEGTNPEELIGAAHAGCFSQALALELAEAGYDPERIETTADVTLAKSGDGFKIDKIDLSTRVSVAEIDKDEFMKLANGAKENCPVSKALAGVRINLQAELV